MQDVASALKGVRLQALIWVSVCLGHGLAIAGVLHSATETQSSKVSTIIRATMLPGLPSVNPSPNPTPARPKPVVPKTTPKVKQVMAAAARDDSSAPAMDAAAVPLPQEAVTDSGEATGEEGSDVSEVQSNASNPAPRYPSLSTRLGEEGKVLFRVLVDENGKVKEVNLYQSSGFKRLDDSALEAIRNWTFTPARRGQENIATWVIVPIVFSLKG